MIQDGRRVLYGSMFWLIGSLVPMKKVEVAIPWCLKNGGCVKRRTLNGARLSRLARTLPGRSRL